MLIFFVDFHFVIAHKTVAFEISKLKQIFN